MLLADDDGHVLIFHVCGRVDQATTMNFRIGVYNQALLGKQ
jgi:hypothetical protein